MFIDNFQVSLNSQRRRLFKIYLFLAIKLNRRLFLIDLKLNRMMQKNMCPKIPQRYKNIGNRPNFLRRTSNFNNRLKFTQIVRLNINIKLFL